MQTSTPTQDFALFKLAVIYITNILEKVYPDWFNTDSRCESVSNNSLLGRSHFLFFNFGIQLCGAIKVTRMCGCLCVHVWVNHCVSSGLSCSWKAEPNFGSRGLPVGFILHNSALCLLLSGNYLPFTSSFRHTLCWAPELNPTRPGETRLGRMPLIRSGPFTLPL